MRLNLECKPDEKLVMCLGVIRKRIRHHNDKGEVCNTLIKSKNEIGLIDQDPNSAQPKYLRNLTELSDELGIKVLEDRNGNKILILKPKLEDWIIASCIESKIDLSGYRLPDTPNQLHKEVNNKLNRFEEVIKALLNAKNPRLRKLQSLIT